MDKFSTELIQILTNTAFSDDPLRCMVEALCSRIMNTEVTLLLNAEKSERTKERKQYRSGYRERDWNTRLGTIQLSVPKLRKGGYVPCFLEKGKRGENALIGVVQEAYIHGISTRKMEAFAREVGLDGLSKSQISEMNKGLSDEVERFRNRPIEREYPILIVDALYEKVRENGHVQSMAIMVICGVNLDGYRELLAVEPMPEESKETYCWLFKKLESRGLKAPKLIISDAHKGLTAAITECLIGSSWQRCKVHFMRNILAHVSRKDRAAFAAELKEIWLAKDITQARERARYIINKYQLKHPKAIDCLKEGLEDSLTYYAFGEVDHRKLSSSNMIERLNREIRRRSRVVSVFPSQDAYLRLITSFLIDYTKDWDKKGRAYISLDSFLSNG